MILEARIGEEKMKVEALKWPFFACKCCSDPYILNMQCLGLTNGVFKGCVAVAMYLGSRLLHAMDGQG